MTATKSETKKIDVGKARELCDNAVLTQGGDYICPVDQPGLVATALKDSELELTDEQIDALADDFLATLLSDPEISGMMDQGAAWLFQGADAADKAGQTWGDSVEAGQKHYDTCWEQWEAEGSKSSIFDDPAVYDNFSI